MRERVFELARAKMHDDEIAAVLTNEGHRSPNCAEKVLPVTVQRIRLLVGVKQAAPRTPGRHPLSVLNAQEFARMLNIPVNWLYVQIEKGTHLFVNTPTVIGGGR